MLKVCLWGKTGDIIYSLPALQAFKESLALYICKKDVFNFIEPLLKCQNYVVHVGMHTEDNEYDIDLRYSLAPLYKSMHMNMSLPHMAANAIGVRSSIYPNNINEIKYFLCDDRLDNSKVSKAVSIKFDALKAININNPDFTWLNVPECIRVNKIAITCTKRYHNWNYLNRQYSPIYDFDYTVLKPFLNSCLFVGTAEDYEFFERTFYLECDSYTPKDALDYACKVKSSKLFVGNFNAGLAIANAIKHPSLIESNLFFYDAIVPSRSAHLQITEELVHSYLNK
jgi:hypothetical protein